MPAAARNRAAIHDLCQDGDVTRLYHIEQVFAEKIHGGGYSPEPDNPAPYAGRTCGIRLTASDFTHQITDAGATTRNQQVDQCDTEVDQETEHEEWQGLGHQAEDFFDAEVNHSSSGFESLNKCVCEDTKTFGV